MREIGEMKGIREREEGLEPATIGSQGVHYRELNSRIRHLIEEGNREIVLVGVNGQRYIGGGLVGPVRITINGVPGNDLGAFMDGPEIVVNDNAQDGVGNTMNSGKIVIKGHAGDVLGYGMRGGKIFVLEDVGYRVGIHMKSYKNQVPMVVAGGRAGDFFGEYMAGGILVLLGMGGEGEPVAGSYIGTGMHGGTIYLRGSVKESQLGREVRRFPLGEEDISIIEGVLAEFAEDVGVDLAGVDSGDFVKLSPFSHRPYGSMYVY